MAMHLIVSNSVEKLAEHFRKEIYLKRTAADFFVPETAVVQSQGMSIWLNQQLSDPIAANLDTPFLNSFADEILNRFFPEKDKPLMTEEWMFWRLFRILLSGLKDYPELARYVSGENNGLKACQLAEKIAELYDQYQIYHPDLLQEWRNPENAADTWQARLFRQISAGAVGRDERFAEFRRERFSEEEVSRLPKRVTLFGISSLAPAYFDFFRKLGEVIEVWFYYLNPSQEYWSENESRKTAARKRCGREWDSLKNAQDPDGPIYGNPLLTSLGRQGQDFFRYLNSLDERPEEEPLFMDHVKPGDNADWQYQYEDWTMLGVLQEDILQNIYRDPNSDENDPGSGKPLAGIAEPDGSVAIHSCHSDLRQVEVLYDQLLALIEKEKFEPRDILVMAPDIGKFEPYIQAVFDGSESRLQNQYTIADRNKRLLNRCADTLLKTLKLLGGRFEVTAVFDLFENEDLAARWDLGTDDLDEIRYWAADLKIHWGVDGEDHERHCGVNFEEFSWKQALDRMILGYAVPENDKDQMYEPVIPFDSAEGKASVKLGNFICFMQTLFETRTEMRNEHTLSEWCGLLDELVNVLFRGGKQNYQDLAALRGTISLLRGSKDPEGAGPMAETPLDLRLVTYLMEKFLLPKKVPEPFLKGKITFCSLMPMRSIPMPVIAILGLEEQNFPRHDFTPGFNVVSEHRQRAALARSKNIEDRYIFLEALLAAKKHLLLFYQGQDPRTSKSRPPAVPVAELEDVLAASFPDCPVEKWETKHRLQAFDSLYFTNGSGLFSYSKSNYGAAEEFLKFRKTMASEQNTADVKSKYCMAGMDHGPVGGSGQEPETMKLTSPKKLESFFRNPCQFYLETVAGLQKTYDNEIILEDEEPVDLSDLEQYELRKTILKHLQEGSKPDGGLYELLRKTNSLPVGSIGKQEYESVCGKIRQIPEIWLKRHFESEMKCVTVDIEAVRPDGQKQSVRIEGEIPVSKETGEPYLLNKSSGSIASDLIRLRLRHLILNAAGYPVTAHFLDWSQIRKLNKQLKPTCCQHLEAVDAESARQKLSILVGYYLEGHFRPLPFFLKAGHTVSPDIQGWQQKKSFRDAFADDYKDPAVQLIFTEDVLDEESPFLEEFGKISHSVFGFTKGRSPRKELKTDD